MAPRHLHARIVFAFAGLGLLLLLLPRPKQAVPVVQAHLAMGTIVTINQYTDEESARARAELAFAEIDRIDSLMSHYSPNSEISRTNLMGVQEPILCSPETAHVLERSLKFSRETDGAFDFTLGALTELWNFPESVSPPPRAAIDSTLALTGYEHVRLRGGGVNLLLSGLQLDLGAAAKGYAVDRAAILMQANGADSGLITAGGDLRYWGQKPDGRDWRLGIQHPREPGQIMEVEPIGLPSIATSGDYEQLFEHQGVRYHHLLDPETGYPSRRSVSATAWANTALDADILSTALFVLGPESGIDWIETVPDAEALIFFEIDDQLDYVASSGVAEKLRIAEKVHP